MLIEFDDWRLRVSTSRYGTGFKRSHRHDNVWHNVRSYSTSSLPKEDYQWEDKWMCSKCSEKEPEEMEGYIKLIRWALDAD